MVQSPRRSSVFKEQIMRRAFLALLGATCLTALSTIAPTQAQSGVNVGSLPRNGSGGMGFICGSSKDMSCLLVRTDGSAERYVGTINKYGVDIGFTKEAS